MPSFFTWEPAPLKEKEVLEHVISAAVHWPSANAGLHRAQLFNSSIKYRVRCQMRDHPF